MFSNNSNWKTCDIIVIKSQLEYESEGNKAKFLDSLRIGIDVAKAYLLGRATSSEDQNLDMDITEIFNNVILN